MGPALQKEHEWLEQLVGEWTYESEAIMEPGKPPAKYAGTESVRSLSGAWVVCEGRGELPDGSPATTVMTLGYDPARARFVGTFIGSMMTYLWVYDGELDAAGRVLTLDTEGPSFVNDRTMAKYKDVIEVKTGDHRVLTSNLRGEDGTWHAFMTAHYRRAR